MTYIETGEGASRVESREERFGRLYETGRNRVVSYAMRRTHNSEEAADVVAETFAVAWRRLEAIPRGERELPWLFTVARKVIANRVRRNSTHATVVRKVAHELSTSSPAMEELDAERLAAIGALDQLSDEDREILMLVAWDGLTSRELGWVLSCSPTAARIRLHRARARLNQVWCDRPVITPSASQLLQEAPEA
jgi:RNA polymerase sigma-70 factor, ECF subfamily